MNRAVRAAALALVLMPIGALANPVDRTANQPPSNRGTTLAEFRKRHAERMMAADTDGDGRVSKAEFLANAGTGKGDSAARFARIDRDGDGYLDTSEIDASLARRFARLDTDHDGVVSAQERNAHAAKGQPAGIDVQP